MYINRYIYQSRAFYWPGTVNANTLLLGVPAMCLYPEPQNTTPFAIDGPSSTEPPLAKVHRIFPLAESSPCMFPEIDGAYRTPFATLTANGVLYAPSISGNM